MSINKFTSTTTSFTVNGRTYSSLDEMPPEVRRDFEETMRKLTADRDGNGVPDIFEGTAESSDQKSVVVTRTTVLNHADLRGIDDLSPELKHALSESLRHESARHPFPWLSSIGYLVLLLVALIAVRLIGKYL